MELIIFGSNVNIYTNSVMKYCKLSNKTVTIILKFKKQTFVTEIFLLFCVKSITHIMLYFL